MGRTATLMGTSAAVELMVLYLLTGASQEYLPFNGGPRICLGQQYALTEALYILTRMVQEFAVVEPRNSQPWTESVTITVSSANGVKVALRWA